MKNFKKALAVLLTLILVSLSIPSAFAAKKKSSASSAPYTMPYYIEVDIANQITTVFRTSDNEIVRQMICTTGMGSRTPRGTFIMPQKKYQQDRQEWYYFPEFKIYAKYASRIYSGILFHSILFSHRGSETPTWASSHALGSKASHGCIRLRVIDAQWIAENCLAGTQVRIFDDGERDSNLRALLKASTFSIDEVTYSEFLNGAVTLSNGVQTDSVKDLQEKLNSLGYDCGKADGYFGSKTAKAVSAWQRDYGYEETGTVSPSLLKTILGAEAVATPVPTAAPEPTPTPDLSSLTGKTATVSTRSWLNVREQPSKSAELLTTLQNGTVVTIISEEGDWAQILFDEQIGYVNSRFLVVSAEEESSAEVSSTPEPSDDEEPAAASHIGATAKVKTSKSKLNLRKKPEADSRIITALKNGTEVTILAEEDGWYQVSYKNKTGYVNSAYLEIIDENADEEVESESNNAEVADNAEVLEFQQPEVDSEETTTEESVAAEESESVADETEDTAEETEATAEESEANADNTVPGTNAEVTDLSNWLNVRSKASFSGRVIERLEGRQRVTVTAVEGQWASVKLSDGSTGYVMAEYLIFDEGVDFALAAPVIETPEGTPATVRSSDGVRLRRNSSEDAGLITTIADGTVVYIQETVDADWVKVYARGFHGYMKSEFLEINEEAAA